MDFSLTEEQAMLADSVARLIEADYDFETRQAIAASDDGFSREPDPMFYVAWGALPQRRMSFLLQVAGPSGGLVSAVRAALGRVDPDIPAADLRMLDEVLAETVVRPRAASLIGGVFAVLAMLVAAAGIYGVLSYMVRRRWREIGIRSALGASGKQIVRLVVGHSTRLTLAGLVLGLAGALVAARAISGLLFGVGAFDPVSLGVATVVLGGVATLAAWIPARRAVRVDPREALRAE